MSPFFSALLANIIIAAVLILLLFMLRMFQKYIKESTHILTSISVGVLLALVFTQFLPKIHHELDAQTAWLSMLFGLLLFYFLEAVLHFHHCHDLETWSCKHEHNPGKLMFLGTLLHNLFHGIVLYSAFTVSVEFGMALTVGILLHALPQNIANYLMNHKNFWIIALAAAGGILGVLVSYPFEQFILQHHILILGITAGGLLYIALSDILPQLHSTHNRGKGSKLISFLVVILSIAATMGINTLSHELTHGEPHVEHSHIQEHQHQNHKE